MKNFLFLIITMTFTLNAFSQPTALKTIDSLKKILPATHSFKRVEILNEIGTEYWKFREFWGEENALKQKAAADSINKYALSANKESSELNYKYGLAFSYLNICRCEELKSIRIPKWNISSNADSSRWKSSLYKLLSIAKELKNDELLGHAYYQMGCLAPWYFSANSDSAVEYKQKAVSHLLKTENNDLLIIQTCSEIGGYYYDNI
jgi:hypothetical protein